METSNDFESRAIQTIRFLSADGVQKANSGHPGLPMGTAAMAFCLWTRHMNFNPKNPDWINRDRFILSGGHGSMLLYSLLHLTGYDLSLDELKNFRQWGSRTPGHPEYGLTPGVEVTTGPLGQGFANGIGMAIAEENLAANFNKPGFDLVNHFIYAIVTDGDLMEGVASESASLAGHLKLGKIIYLYDDNHISIDGSTDLAFTEDRVARFAAYHWHVQTVDDGNDIQAIDLAIQNAKNDPRPSIIAVRTIIGYGLPTRQGTSKAHGEAPGQVELNAAKTAVGYPPEPMFFIAEDVAEYFLQIGRKGQRVEQEWQKKFDSYQQQYPDLAREFIRRISGNLPSDWEKALPVYPPDKKGTATRITSGLVINQLAKTIPELLGGSADLAPSNKTWIDNEPAFQSSNPTGRNFHFGVREHAMGSIVNGISVYGGFIPYCGTFLTFADYERPAIRLSALSDYPSIWIFTHDSIGLGEDGPTHQPVEHLASLRCIPNLVVIRPADANEVVASWKVAIKNRKGPTVITLSRQNLPILDRELFTPAEELSKGAYVLADIGDFEPNLILMASGSEVSLIVDAGLRLAAEGRNVRLVSFPSWELFSQQDQAYQDSVLPPTIKARIAVEAGVRMGWERWIGDQGKFIGMRSFGKSAPFEVIYSKMGITVEEIIYLANQLHR